MTEVAEGANTVRLARKCADPDKVRTLVTDCLYKVLFEGMTVEQALDFMIRPPLSAGIDFI
jgi:glycerol-3-phosphate dehydrogenase (NAD(P)+)